MGSGPSLPENTGHVVVVGGGYAGCELARKLKQAGAKYTLIDPRDSFHHCVAAVRAVVEEDIIPKMFIPYAETFGDNFKQGKVTSVDHANKKVMLEGDGEVSYDILVLCTGSTMHFPAKADYTQKTEAVEFYKDYLKKVQSATKIVLVGGGPVGVELAGELGTDLKDKEITLIHSREKLCGEDLNDNWQKKVKSTLTGMGIKLVLGEKVTNLNDISDDGPVTLKTDKGTEIEADLVMKCIGSFKINSDAYSTSMGSSVDDRGCLKVNEYLQVEGYDDIFAIGDCVNTNEPKVAYLGQQQAATVFHNLGQKAREQPLKTHKLDDKPMVLGVSLGRNHGALQLKNGMLPPELLVRKVKCKDLMLAEYYKRFGQTLPS